MKKTNNPKAADELYRDYQTHRDNIPPALLNNLRAAAASQSHEDNIHVILEQAKVQGAQATSAESKPVQLENAASPSFGQRLRDWFSPAWGGAIAAAALIAIVAGPNLLNNSPYSHLANCAECVSHARNASALTRSTAIGQAPLSVPERTAARLGRISAKLKIAESANLSQLDQSARQELIKFAKQTDNELLLTAAGADHSDTVRLLNDIAQAESVRFNASESLFIANVSARNALKSDNAADALPSFGAALEDFNRIQQPSELQRNLASQLQSVLATPDLTEAKLKKIIELSRRAMETLGA